MKRSPGTEHLEAEVRSYPGSRTVSATDKYVHVGRIYPKTWMTRRVAGRTLSTAVPRCDGIQPIRSCPTLARRILVLQMP